MDKEPADVWHQYIEEVFNERNLDLVEVLFAHDYVMNGELFSHAQIRANLQALFDAFPDCYLSVNKQFTRGICVICNWTLHGTHLGDYQGKAPTGIQVRLRGSSEACIYRGKIVKQWREMDDRSLMQQLEPSNPG